MGFSKISCYFMLLAISWGAFLEEKLPLKVLSISPSELTKVGQTTRQAILLRGIDPITVVFTRPVIALGSDFQALDRSVQGGLNSAQNPFKLVDLQGKELNVSGKLRWPTTYIARFDPDATWATDLEFTLNFNPTLQSHDGVRLTYTDAPPAFQTPFLSGSFTSVDSELAKNMTGGAWTPTVGSETEPEAPPDAEIRYEFSNSVDLDLIRKSFVLSIKQGSLGNAAVTFSKCLPRPRNVIFDFMPPPQNEDLSSCVLIKPTNLAQQGSYMLTLPAGATYHPNAGMTHKPLTFIFHGLYPFTFTPQSFTQWYQPRYRRMDFYLRHGLKLTSELEHFRKTLTITSGTTSLPFDVSRQDNVTMRIQANFEPATTYRFLFLNNVVQDGFGQMFRGLNFSFTTAPTDAVFQELYGSEYAVFATKNAPSAWKVMTRSSAGGQQQDLKISLGAVNPANFASSLSARGYQATKFPSSISTQPATANLRVQNLTMPGNFFLRQREYPNYDGTKNYQGSYASITDLGVSVISAGDSVDVWVTNMTTGANVVGAVVSVYSQQSWGFSATATLVGSQVTGQDGTANIKISKQEGGQFLLYVSKAVGNTQDQTFVEYYQGSASEGSTSATVVMDRGVYKPGDTINVKVFATKRDGQTLKPFSDPGCTVLMQWEQPAPPTWQPIQQTLKVDWDTTYGTWFTSIEVPANVTFGAKTLSVVNSNQGWITSATVLIADPRRPTASLEFSAESIWVLGETINITGKVLTGTDQPIANANIDVKWTVSHFTPIDFYSPPSATSPPVNGSFVMTTGSDGTFTKQDFNIEGVKAGESISFEATYLGPTGEVLEQSAQTTTATSKWSISLEPDNKFGALTQLPGFEFGWIVQTKDENGKAMASAGSIELYPVDSDKSARSCQFNVQPDFTGSVCAGFTLPKLGAFVAVATTKDDKQRTVTANYSLGRSEEDWKNSPLNKYFLQDFGFVLDKSSYAVGDIAKVNFDSPFTGASVWLNTNGINQQSAATKGRNEVSFTVPQTCFGGCSLSIVLSVPAQPAEFAQKVDASGVPISVWVDLRGPRAFQSSLNVNVPDTKRQINVNIVPPAKSAPGDSVKFTVQLTDPKTNAPATGEVAIFVVDRAFIQVSPYPLVHINESFTLSSSEYRSSFDNRQNLVSASGAELSLSKFVSRLNQDPWVGYSDNEADQSDEDFFRMKSTRVTEWGMGQSYVSNRARGGIMFAETSYSARVPMMAMASMAAPAPMAMDSMSQPSGGGQAKMEMEVGSPNGGGGGGGAAAVMPVRTKFETAPLFIGRRVVTGSGEFNLQLPDNIGTFTIRAYVVDATSRFGQDEAEVITTKPLTIQPMFPRFVRPGDIFDCGVIVSGDSASYNSRVSVSIRPSNSTVALMGADGASVSVKGTTPVKVKFPMSAVKIGDSYFKFTAQDSATGQDAFEDKFSVLPTQDAVVVATSMAIQASANGQKWDEGISFPPMIPGSGSLGLNAAVGRLPVVETLASVVLNSKQKTSPEEDGYSWVSRALFRHIFTRYPNADGPVETLARDQFPGTVSALKKLTDPRLGLRWSNRYPPNAWDTPDTGLNGYGVYAAFRSYLQVNPASINISPFRGMKTPIAGAANLSVNRMPNGPQRPMVTAMPPMLARPPMDVMMAPAGENVGFAPPPPMMGPPSGRALLQSDTLLPLDLVQQWAVAMERGIVTQFYDSVRYGGNFSDWDLLVDTLTVLGLDWTGPKLVYTPSSGPAVAADVNPATVLSLQNLQRNQDKLSYGAQVRFALAYVLRGEPNPMVSQVVNQTIARMLVQGRTAYLKVSQGSNNAASTSVQAAALELLALTNANHPFVEKLANYLAQGNAGFAGTLYSWSAEANALSSLAFAMYDLAKKNMNANATLKVSSGAKTVLEGAFRGANSRPVVARISPDTLPQSNQSGRAVVPEGLQFVAQGVGEVSVAALIDFVPALISPDPIYRGIYVERTIQKADGGKGVGPSLQLVTAGDFVVVTIQITSPDDLTGVLIQDLLPGGLEAIDPRLGSGGGDLPMPMYNTFSRSTRFIFPPWRDPFGSANVYPDRVTWQADWLRQGTYSVKYTAVAVTSGTFLHPPTKVISVPQPEVMGLSGGGFLVVSEEAIAPEGQQQYLQDRNIAPEKPFQPIECKTACPDSGFCNLRTGICEAMVEMRMLSASPPAPIAKPQSTDGTGKGPAKPQAKGKGKAANAAVKNLMASNITSTSVQLTWAALPGQAGPYSITYRKVGVALWRKLADKISGFSFNATGLTAQTEYQFRVEATGKFSIVNAQTTA